MGSILTINMLSALKYRGQKINMELNTKDAEFGISEHMYDLILTFLDVICPFLYTKILKI